MLQVQKSLSDIRRELHRLAEPGGSEKATSEFLIEELKKYNPASIITNLGGHGLAAVFGEKTDQTIMLRCDIDALPIEDRGVTGHRSLTPGTAHKCGHDGHMAIMIGVAEGLKNVNLKNGRVVLLFQPDEESGNGAKAVIADKKFGEIKPDYIFALHNYPGEPAGKIICRNGIFTSASKGATIIMEGKTSHAAEPENGVNPRKALQAVADFISDVDTLTEHREFVLGTVVYQRLGEREAFGVSPGYAELMATLRANSNSDLSRITAALENKIRDLADTAGFKYRINYRDEFDSTINFPESFELVKKCARLNNFDFEEKEVPYKWSEDFGYFTQQIKGALFCLGAGENQPPLHNPDYDFPDEIISHGVKMFNSIIKNYLEVY